MSKNPKVVIRRSGKHVKGTNGSTGKAISMEAIPSQEPSPHSESLAPEVESPAPETSEDRFPSGPSSTDMNSAVVEKPIPGFNLEGASRNQQYVIRSVVILCDCSVQRNADGVFDVLARNFGNTGILTWWLGRVGKAHLVDQVKGKDLVDAIRKVAHSLHRELSGVIGRPMARW